MLIWNQGVTNELGRITHGIQKIAGNDVVDYIKKEDVPSNKVVTYANMVCNYRPNKADPFMVRLTVGGNKLQYDLDATLPAANLIKTKVFLYIFGYV